MTMVNKFVRIVNKKILLHSTKIFGCSPNCCSSQTDTMIHLSGAGFLDGHVCYIKISGENYENVKQDFENS